MFTPIPREGEKESPEKRTFQGANGQGDGEGDRELNSTGNETTYAKHTGERIGQHPTTRGRGEKEKYDNPTQK